MSFSFKTSRLSITEISAAITPAQLASLLDAIPHILTPDVVENLPPYFQNIKTKADALVWFERMIAQSRLLMVNDSEQGEVIGFLFAFVDNKDAHIGYLLKQSYWGQGLASELLKAFIEKVPVTQSWQKLIGGVDRSNKASAKLLLKLGFVERLAKKDSDILFYEYWLTKP
jgi:RimJ/RimL family protein N-acetyltransferase